MIGAESLRGRPDLETTRKGHTPEAPEAQKRAVEGVAAVFFSDSTSTSLGPRTTVRQTVVVPD
jgi:hypothetical protein